MPCFKPLLPTARTCRSSSRSQEVGGLAASAQECGSTSTIAGSFREVRGDLLCGKFMAGAEGRKRARSTTSSDSSCDPKTIPGGCLRYTVHKLLSLCLRRNRCHQTRIRDDSPDRLYNPSAPRSAPAMRDRVSRHCIFQSLTGSEKAMAKGLSFTVQWLFWCSFGSGLLAAVSAVDRCPKALQ